MLRELRLRNFRAFRDFRISVGDGAYLVGPNNAGKSTVLTAIRLADVLLRLSQRRNPTQTRLDGDRHFPAWSMSLVDFPALRESIRYEFRDDEVRLELTWKNGAKLTGIWPEEEGEFSNVDPFFYLERQAGVPVRAVSQARDDFSPLGVIPILGPIDHSERLLSERYVTQNISGRLSSRHFRNQLYLLRQRDLLDDFLNFAEPWLDGITVESFSQHLDPDGAILDVYYLEPGSRIPKELVWAGDGIQVWLQLLYHVYRVKSMSTIVLDEPEVYLHPDLQRRLVHLLESTDRQIVVATHSSELAAEAEPRLVTLVEKTRGRARRARDESALEWLSTALGTAFNLRLARALRSSVVLFVEGQDLTVLRRFAKSLALTNLETERGIAVIKLEGFTRSGHVAPFAWLCHELLPDAIRPFVLLDRDYRSDESVEALEKEFADVEITAHVWRRKELESYLLTPTVISRLSGVSVDQAEQILADATLTMDNDVFGRMLDERIRAEVGPSRHAVDVTSDFKRTFDEHWPDPAFRLAYSPAKQVIARLNTTLQGLGRKSVSARSLAAAHRAGEIDPEMTSTLRQIDTAVAPSR